MQSKGKNAKAKVPPYPQPLIPIYTSKKKETGKTQKTESRIKVKVNAPKRRALRGEGSLSEVHATRNSFGFGVWEKKTVHSRSTGVQNMRENGEFRARDGDEVFL